MLLRWYKNRNGATAIEFSLLAVPFMFTCIALIELSLYFATGSLLESAVQDAARLIKTGQLQQSAGDPEQEFLDAICDRTGMLVDCSQVQYQVAKLDDFNDSADPGLDEDGNMTPPDLFELNQIMAGCVALVRIVYPYQFLTPLYGRLWSNYPNSTRLLMSTVAFQTEPFNFNVVDPTCSLGD
ncbi:MAG: pilus assembly protein [Rhodospirillales bacterium]|nr:pilus assembly protein [Rhodospirillales bacterium]MCB9994981.1 pilus assembly protein [Rhodospirillales bacterium]